MYFVTALRVAMAMPIYRSFAAGLFVSILAFSPYARASDVANSNPAPEVGSQPTLAMDIDAGVVFPFATIEAPAIVTNIGQRAVRVDRVVARWAGTEAEIDFAPATVLPGKSLRVGLRIQNGSNAGHFSHIFLLYDNNQKLPVGKIAVRGFTDWIVNPTSLTSDLGILKSDDSIERVLKPETRPGTEVILERVNGKNDWFDASIVENGHGLRISGRPHMPWGPFDTVIVVGTDSPIQKKVGFHLKGEVRGAIVPSMSAIQFGLVRVGVPSEQALRLVDETGKKISIGDIDVTGASAKATIENCVPAIDSCRVVKLVLNESQMGEAPHGLMKISFPDYGATLPIPFGGALVGKDTVVRDLEKEVEASRSSHEGISAALKSSVSPVKPLEMGEPVGKGPLLKWEMANESTIFGYEIYRSDHADVGFVRANTKIVPRLSKDASVPSVYRWRDTDAKSGNVYWYYIGVVYLDGRKESLNSPQKVTAK